MAADHARAIAEAERSAKALKAQFDKLGNTQHPRGRVLNAYRQATRAIRGSNGSQMALMEILAELRATLTVIAQDTLWEAAQRGTAQARAQTALYGLPSSLEGYTPISELAAWLATFDVQRASVLALASAGRPDIAAIVGDASRVGILSPAPVIRDGARWLAATTVTSAAVATLGSIDRSNARGEFGKQAIAAIDERTTDCCLRAHGQVVPIDGQFTLTGTPRYADKMSDPPFHWYCRTATALVRMREAGDRFTQEMQDAGRAELAARGADDNRRVISPAYATSRR